MGARGIKLHGSIESNLRAALTSARRLRGHPVHEDTLTYWNELLAYARQKSRAGNQTPSSLEILRELSIELAEHYMDENGT